MNRKRSEVIHISFSLNAHRILMRECKNNKNIPAQVIDRLIVEHLITTKQKVDDIMNGEWID